MLSRWRPPCLIRYSSCAGLDGDNIRPRGHHFAHPLIAEFHHLLDQIGLFRFDDSFFFRGFHLAIRRVLKVFHVLGIECGRCGSDGVGGGAALQELELPQALL